MKKNAINMLAEVIATFSTHQQPLHSREKLIEARKRRIQLARSLNSSQFSPSLKNHTSHNVTTAEDTILSIKLSKNASNRQVNWLKFNIMVGIYKNWLRLAPFIIHLLKKDERRAKFNQIIQNFHKKQKILKHALKIKNQNESKDMCEQNFDFSTNKGQIFLNKNMDENCDKLIQEYKIIKKQINQLAPWLQRHVILGKQNQQANNFLRKSKKLQSYHEIMKQNGELKKIGFTSLKKIKIQDKKTQDLVSNRLDILEKLEKFIDEIDKKSIQKTKKSFIQLMKLNQQEVKKNSMIVQKEDCLESFGKMKNKIKQISLDYNGYRKSQQKDCLQALAKTAAATPNFLGLQNSEDERNCLNLHSAQKYKIRNSFRPSKVFNHLQKGDIFNRRQSIRKKPSNFECSIENLQPIFLQNLLQNGITNIKNVPQSTNPFVIKSKQRLKLLKKTIPLNKIIAENKQQQKKKDKKRKQSNTTHQFIEDSLDNEKISSNTIYFKSNYLIKYKSKKNFDVSSHEKFHRISKDDHQIYHNKTMQHPRSILPQDKDFIAQIENQSFQHNLKSKTRTKRFKKIKNSLLRYNGGRKSSKNVLDAYKDKKKDSMLKKMHQKKQYPNNIKRSSNLPYKIEYNYKFNDQQLNFKRKKVIDVHRYSIEDERFEKEQNIIRKKQIIINCLKKMVDEGVLENIDEAKRNAVLELIQKQCPDDYLLADFFDYDRLNKIKKMRRQAIFYTNQKINKQKSFYQYLNKLKKQLIDNSFDPQYLDSLKLNVRNRRDSKAYLDLSYNKKCKNQELSQSNKILNKNQNLFLQLVDQFINQYMKNRNQLIQTEI